MLPFRDFCHQKIKLHSLQNAEKSLFTSYLGDARAEELEAYSRVDEGDSPRGWEASIFHSPDEFDVMNESRPSLLI